MKNPYGEVVETKLYVDWIEFPEVIERLFIDVIFFFFFDWDFTL